MLWWSEKVTKSISLDSETHSCTCQADDLANHWQLVKLPENYQCLISFSYENVLFWDHLFQYMRCGTWHSNCCEWRLCLFVGHGFCTLFTTLWNDEKCVVSVFCLCGLIIVLGSSSYDGSTDVALIFEPDIYYDRMNYLLKAMLLVSLWGSGLVSCARAKFESCFENVCTS